MKYNLSIFFSYELGCAFVVVSKTYLPNPRLQRFMLSSSTCIVLVLHLGLLYIFSSFCIWCEICIKVLFFFAMNMQLFQQQFLKRLSLLECLYTSVKNQLSIYVWLYFWTLVCWYVCVIKPHSLIYHDLKSGTISPPTVLLFYKVILATLGPLHFQVNFRIRLSISTQKTMLGFWLGLHWIFLGGRIYILTILNLPICEDSVSLHLFRSLLIVLSYVWSFEV